MLFIHNIKCYLRLRPDDLIRILLALDMIAGLGNQPRWLDAKQIVEI